MGAALLPSPTALSRPPDVGVRLSLVTELSELEKLRPEWERLLASSAHAEPMLEPDWLLTWWNVYGQGRSLRVAVFKQGKEIVGLAPLLQRRYWHRPGIPFRRL